jgi:hypothetical protein
MNMSFNSQLAYFLLAKRIEGREAFFARKQIHENPYSENSSEWKAWDNGFEDARWNVDDDYE